MPVVVCAPHDDGRLPRFRDLPGCEVTKKTGQEELCI
jgi:hypothetical protein